MFKYSVITRDGSQQELDIDVSAYKEAGELGLSLSQLLERKYPADRKYGSTFEQCMQSSGLFLRNDAETGIRATNMKEVIDGSVQVNMGAITRSDGANRHTVSGRLLFPEVIMQIIESELSESKEDFLGGYNSLIATTAFVTSPRVDQPIIDVTGPQADEYRSQPIAQLAEPAALITITVGEKSFNVPTKSIGLQISDQALEATSLDLVGIAITQQARQERIRMVLEQLSAMISGDVDFNEAALSSVTQTSFDGTAAAGTMTQKAWVKYLRANYQKMNISNILCDVDTALKIQDRTGKPTVTNDDPTSPRIDVTFSVQNLGIAPPRILLVDSTVSGADTVIGLDSRFAIRRVVNVNAAYSAIENYVMRRATSFRVDYGEMAQKLMTDAWSVMTIA